MSRYIDADKLQEEFKELHGGKRSLLIDTQPTDDVVEVVRCKDCLHGSRTRQQDVLWCNITDEPMTENDFCSKGDRI